MTELTVFGSTPSVTSLGTVIVVPVSVDRDSTLSEPSRLLALPVRCRFKPWSVAVPVVMIPVAVTSPPIPLKPYVPGPIVIVLLVVRELPKITRKFVLVIVTGLAVSTVAMPLFPPYSSG